MSESKDSPDEIFNVRAISEFEEDDEALEVLVQLKELDFGEVFNNRETKLDSEDGEGISIKFTHKDENNLLNLTTDDDSNITIHLNLSGNSLHEGANILKKLIENMSNISIELVNLYKTYDVPFNSLDLPIDEDTGHRVVGLRIEENDREFIIQQANDDKTSINMWLEDPEGDTQDIVDNIGQQAVGSTTEFIHSFS